MIATDVVAVVTDNFIIGSFGSLPPYAVIADIDHTMPNGSNEILPEAVM